LAGFWASLAFFLAFFGFLAFYSQSSFRESTAVAYHLLSFSLMALFGLFLWLFQTKKGRTLFPRLVSILVIVCIVLVRFLC
jgi:hypothetical protein